MFPTSFRGQRSEVIEPDELHSDSGLADAQYSLKNAAVMKLKLVELLLL